MSANNNNNNNNTGVSCTSFKPHQLRPDKCRNCFGDKSKHQLEQPAPEQVTTGEAHKLQQHSDRDGPSQPEGAARLSRLEGEHAKEKEILIERYEKEIAKLKEDLRAASRGADTDRNCKQCQSYRSELEAFKSQCQSLESERDRLKEELRALEREMDEMHDTFKEEESEQFEQTKQELDLAMKNCKILQIRLHKAERQYGQLEQVKSMLEQQLGESNNRVQLDSQHPIKSSQQSSIEFTQIGNDFVKLSTSEYDKLLKELSDIFEREKDLQEQIKYSQEEAQLKSDRLQSVEAENEILLNKVSKLTLANSRLRAQASSTLQQHQQQQQLQEAGDDRTCPSSVTTLSDIREAIEEKSKLIQECEQLKLALDFAQSECDRLKSKLQESQSQLDSLKNALQSSESKRLEFEAELGRLRLRRQASFEASSNELEDPKWVDQVSKLELECRQLRSKLVQSERDNRQLRSMSKVMSSSSSSEATSALAAQRQSKPDCFMTARGISVPKSHSMDMTTASSATVGNGSEQARYRELNRQLREQCDSLREQNERLEQKLEDLTLNSGGVEGGSAGGGTSAAGGQSTPMESDLLEKLKRRLDFSESELAKVRSRLVEMDLECSRVQRQHKRLVQSLENSSTDSSGLLLVGRRKVKLPPESMRDSMSRQELRQTVRELDEELDECLGLLRAKDCLINERASETSQAPARDAEGRVSTGEEQVKSLHRLLDQERLLSNNLKIDVNSLEETKQELESSIMMLERERVAMEEELDKLRSLNMELNTDNEDLKRTNRSNSSRLKDLQASYERVRVDLLKSQQQQQQRRDNSGSSPTATGESNDMLLMARDLSELKVKNGFLMRQLEIAREENARQMEDLKQAHEIQQRRVVEMAQIELRERHLAESQQLRDELNEVRQKLAASQRQVTRQEEEVAGERDRLRSMERDWRRERGQLQQKIEQLEAQLALERRSNEFRVKEIESTVREKERDLISLQDKCVQFERDLKRTQNKYSLLEENSNSKQKSLSKELETKKRELGDLIATNHARDEHYYEQCKRFNSEKSTLSEALESLRRSYDEKLTELKSSRELLSLRQDQAYKERLVGQEKLDELTGQLMRMSEHKTRARLLEQQLQLQERQVESLRRECLSLKEDKLKLKGRCDELESRCSHYEKQELISKTSSISSSSSANLFARAKQGLSSSGRADSTSKKQFNSSRATTNQANNNSDQQQQANPSGGGGDGQMIERLTSKINDQRHLISMLKEQYESAQMESKQMKLVQSAERQKWQTFSSQLQSRLNEAEEKLLFEASLTNQATFESCRRKFELKWNEERKSSLDIIQQQQAQNENLMKDFKRISQQHDLLRLHAKQLESNNQKLSKKLIEYQNNQAALSRHKPNQAAGPEISSERRQLADCLAHKEALMRQQNELNHLNSSLLDLLRNQVRPLVETVNKIMSAIESTPPSSSDKQTREEMAASGERRLSNPAGSRPESADEGSKSTLRPLITSNSRQSHSSAEITTDHPSEEAAQVQQSPSRLARLFTSHGAKSPAADTRAAKQSPTSARSVKKVRVKSAALGITPSEKRQLKERLGELSKAIEELSSPKKAALDRDDHPNRPMGADHSNVGGSLSVSVSSSSPTAQSRVRWQLDESDLESERSWSIQSDANRSNLYRRFPQSSPSSHHHHHVRQPTSLTDYESESSCAGSDISLAAPAGAHLRTVSGVESDSCMASAAGLRSKSASSSSAAKRRGLKMRFTDTLRNISRSITGLASDSESESAATNPGRPKRKDPRGSSLFGPQSNQPKQAGQNLKEIRV